MWRLLHTLPRDSRDTLLLLLVVAWIVLPLSAELPLWCSAMVATLLLWRSVLAWRGAALPSRWWLVGLLVLAAAGTFASHRTLLGRDAGVTFVVVLLALKTLELRAKRDVFVVFFLGFFTLLSNFFYTQSLPVAFAMVVGLLGLLTVLVNHHMPVGKPPLRQAARLAGTMALLGTPLMVALFMLFPRVAPLWGLPQDAMRARSGLSSTMEVGTIARLALDSSIAMQVRFEGEVPARRDLYFRGPVLSRYDGVQWRGLPFYTAMAAQQAKLQVEGPATRYEITLQPNNLPWLPVLDATLQAPIARGYTPAMGPDQQWRVERPIAELLRYAAQSHLQYRYEQQSDASSMHAYLALPQGFNPGTLAMGNQIRQRLSANSQGAPPSAPVLVDAALHLLRTGGYTYTLEPGVFGVHTADEFWLERKQGFCEHIASAFVVLMRGMGIPARVVTGYQGGERNPFDGFWTVRQSDAHAWTEVWLESRGWVRVDPTAAVAPSRTESLQRLEAPAGAFTQALVNVNPGLVRGLRTLWDAANNSWNQWVLNYTQERQLNLLRNLGFSTPSWQDLGYLLAAVLGLGSLLAGSWAFWGRHRQDPWLQLLSRARRRLQQSGLPVPPHASPRQLASLLAQPGACSENARAQWTQWLLELESMRYAAPPDGVSTNQQGLATLRHALGTMPKPL